MPGDPLSVGIQRELGEQQIREIRGDIVPHPEMRRPGILRRVHIETGALAKVIGRVVGHAVAHGRGVWEHQRDARVRGPGLRPGLGHRVLVRACQARQVPQQRHRALCRLRRQVQAERHLAPGRGAGMGIDPLHPAETGVFGSCFH